MRRFRSSPSPTIELALEPRVQRGVACINVRHEDKEVFDRIQSFLELSRGRRIAQWDAFTLLLADALGSEAEDASLRGFR